jgi:hypothetical protein
VKHKPMAMYGLLLSYVARDVIAEPHAWERWLALTMVVAMAIHAVAAD